MRFKEIPIDDLSLNPFSRIGKGWMLITAGNEHHHNTMTASWGGMGVVWNKNTATVYIRPQRYTREFVDQNDTFTLSFFSENYRDALTLLGQKSGRDGDKIAEAGLTPCPVGSSTAFAEADMVLLCRKLYRQEMAAEYFCDPQTCENSYPNKDYHIMYVGEITKILVRS